MSFTSEAAIAGMAEVELGEMAMQQGSKCQGQVVWSDDGHGPGEPGDELEDDEEDVDEDDEDDDEADDAEEDDEEEDAGG